tara:strand:+ start:2081 stop:2368 length:288 start_codon:yes stop_codon:yes gene_type:complete
MSIDKIRPEDYEGHGLDRVIVEKKSATTALDKQVGGKHYKQYPIQPVEFCQKNGLNAIESSIVKYAVRHRDKGGKEDVEKIIHYAKLLLELEYAD